jgi:hypothetical protein
MPGAFVGFPRVAAEDRDVRAGAAGNRDYPGRGNCLCRQIVRTAPSGRSLDAGVPLRDVQEAASHADPHTTMRNDRPSPGRFPGQAAPAWPPRCDRPAADGLSPPLESSAPHGARGSRLSMWPFLLSAERKCPLCTTLAALRRRRRAGGGQVVPAHLHSRRAACPERQVVAGVGVAVPAPAGRLVLHSRGLSGPTAGEALLDLPVMRSEGDASRPGRPRRNCHYSAYSRSSSTFAATCKALREPTSEAGNCRKKARHPRARP